MEMSAESRPIISIGDADESDFEDEECTSRNRHRSGSRLSDEDQVFDGEIVRRSGTEDWMHMAYLILYLQGVGSLLPWNFFITARGYFEQKFANEPSIKNSFESAFSVGAMVPNVLSLLVNVFLTKQVNRNLRMVTCIVVTLLCFIATTVFVKVDTTSWTKGFFGLTVAIVALINMACAIYGGTFFGVGSVIGQKYTQALMGGQGLGGTFAALASIFSLLGDSKPEESAFGYFLTAVGVIILCIIGYFVFFRLAFVNYCLSRNEIYAVRGSQSSMLAPKPALNALFASSSSLASATSIGSSLNHSIEYPVREKTPYWEILKALSPMALSVSFVFFVTLSLFPSIVSGILSVNKDNGSKWTNQLFAPMMCFLLFNLGDLAGRTMAGFMPLFSEKSIALRVLCASRIIFIPLFALCNYRPDSRRFPVVFNNDICPIILNVFFATSNGYLGSLCMMYGPKLVNGKHAEVAGTIMALFLSSGLALGAGFSFVVAAII